MSINTFHGRNLVIATKHEKERVIAPLLEKNLGVITLVLNNLDTDVLGTFTGEIERKNDPISTARLKCLKALELSGGDLAIASEGSFGSHPDVFFAKANDELVLLVDTKNNLEIIGRKLSLETNFNGSAIKSWTELTEFANEASFPNHGLILRKAEKSAEIFEKGIRSWNKLKDLGDKYLDTYGEIWVETDMRAMHNPMRMKVIEQATENLIENTLSLCPQCSFPGFVPFDAILGLPCALCLKETRSVQSMLYLCKNCGFKKTTPRLDGKTFEDPMYCDFCNP